MIALTSTLRSLELDLASAQSAAMDIVVTFSNIRYSDQSKNAGTQLSNSNGTTDVTICSAPGAGELRLIESISIQNPAASDQETVRVYYDDNGTEYDIIRVPLDVGEQLHYEDNQGWKVITASGQLKTTGANGAAGANGADGSTFTLGTEQATTSGTEVEFTGIPAGTKEIILSFEDVSTNGTSGFLIQMGPSGGVDVTGYTSTAVPVLNGTVGTLVTATNGFVVGSLIAAGNVSGQLRLTLQDSTNHVWSGSAVVDRTSNGAVIVAAGTVDLSGELSRLKLTTVSGDTFDAGAINIAYV